jgi:hypothetical protein
MKLRIYIIDIVVLILIPIILGYILYSIIPINNFEPLSVVSVTSSVNLLIWIGIIIQILVSIYLFKNKNLEQLLNFNLYISLIYITTTKLLIEGLALKGTPLPDSDIRGDLLAIVQLAQNAEKNLWSGSGYPPVWPTIIGNIARILDIHVLAIFKPAELILLAVSPFLIFLTWKLILKSWMALTITIFQTLSSSFNYKNLALNILIPFIIFVIISAVNQMNINIKIRLKYLIYGISIGLISLMYFGYLYWLTPFLILLTVLSFFGKNRSLLIEIQLLVFLGIALAIIPIIYPLTQLKMSNLYLVILITILFLITNSQLKGRNFINLAGSTIIIFVLLIILFDYRANDEWFEGGIEQNNPTLNPILPFDNYKVIFILLFLYLIYRFISKKEYYIYLQILIAIYLSSTFFMYLIASQMQISKRVDLWPRATEIQSYVLSLTSILIIILILENIFEKISIQTSYDENPVRIQFIYLFAMLIIGSYFVSNLGNQTYAVMPTQTFNGAWYAHQGCSNPHKDPMLAKVFENYSDIQKFLRSNCSSVNWPEVASIK